MRRPALALVLCLSLAGGAAHASAPPEALFPLAEVRAGLVGYGLSVFRGGEVERFGVEVVGVLRNLQPGTSFILARLSGQNLERTGVLAGMSGSPVYLDGRLAGAVAFGWTFQQEALCGITPIEAMRAIPAGKASQPPSARAVDLADLSPRAERSGALERALGGLLPAAPANTAQPGIAWVTSGLPAATSARLERALGPVASAGGGGSPAPLEPGAAIAAVLIDGDFRIAATGTLTERRGDELLAFGHPLYGLGPVALPLAGAEVVAIVASDFVSFKLSNLGPVVGRFDYDQATGLRGRLGAQARQIPLRVAIEGPPARSFDLRLADLPELTPVLAAFGLVASLDAATSAGAAQGIDLDLRLRLAGEPELALRQSFDGDGAAGEMAGWLLSLVGFFARNPFEPVAIEAIEARLHLHPEPRTLAIVGARPLAAQARAGERVGLEIDLLPYRGEPRKARIEVDLPASLPAGRYTLGLADGASADLLRLQLEPRAPRRLGQVLDWIRSLTSSRELVVFGVVPERGVSASGELLRRLPPTAQVTRAPALGRGDRALRLAVVEPQRFPFDAPLAGSVRVDLEVRATEVMSAKEKP